MVWRGIGGRAVKVVNIAKAVSEHALSATPSTTPTVLIRNMSDELSPIFAHTA